MYEHVRTYTELLSLRQSGFIKHRMTCVHARLLGPCFKTGQVFTDLLISYSTLTSLTVETCVKPLINHTFARNVHIGSQQANSHNFKLAQPSRLGTAQAFEATTKPCKSAGYWHMNALRTLRWKQCTHTGFIDPKINAKLRTTHATRSRTYHIACIAYSR